ncbi:MAG: aldo/keto reductase [Promicromonosporaceae bacterium]|nr:aldo/keto reductase [Promicromonosporaceae bacterium]
MVLALRPLGSTGLQVTEITLGGGPLGSMPALFGTDTSEAAALDVIQTALDAGIRTIDTANEYSGGESERRIGKALREFTNLPPDLLIITKVDPKNGDYSGDRVRASLAESRKRLGLDYLPLALLHDPEFHDFDYLTQPGGAVDALVAARDAGEVGHIGLGMGDARVAARYWDLGMFEVLLTHNRYTLVDRSAGPLIERVVSDGGGVMNAGVLGGGALTDPVRVPGKYCYHEAKPQVLDAIEAMRQACRRYGVNLATAATQFSLRDPRIASTVIGMSQPERVAEAIDAINTNIPDALWGELETLVPAPEFWLDA